MITVTALQARLLWVTKCSAVQANVDLDVNKVTLQLGFIGRFVIVCAMCQLGHHVILHICMQWSPFFLACWHLCHGSSPPLSHHYRHLLNHSLHIFLYLPCIWRSGCLICSIVAFRGWWMNYQGLKAVHQPYLDIQPREAQCAPNLLPGSPLRSLQWSGQVESSLTSYCLCLIILSDYFMIWQCSVQDVQR